MNQLLLLRENKRFQSIAQQYSSNENTSNQKQIAVKFHTSYKHFNEEVDIYMRFKAKDNERCETLF